jgi:hypothetical protein
MKLKINKSYRKLFPNNCPLIEKTADGVPVGTCTFYMKDGKTCPRHGDITKHESNN